MDQIPIDELISVTRYNRARARHAQGLDDSVDRTQAESEFLDEIRDLTDGQLQARVAAHEVFTGDNPLNMLGIGSGIALLDAGYLASAVGHLSALRDRVDQLEQEVARLRSELDGE